MTFGPAVGNSSRAFRPLDCGHSPLLAPGEEPLMRTRWTVGITAALLTVLTGLGAVLAFLSVYRELTAEEKKSGAEKGDRR